MILQLDISCSPKYQILSRSFNSLNLYRITRIDYKKSISNHQKHMEHTDLLLSQWLGNLILLCSSQSYTQHIVPMNNLKLVILQDVPQMHITMKWVSLIYKHINWLLINGYIQLHLTYFNHFIKKLTKLYKAFVGPAHMVPYFAVF